MKISNKELIRELKKRFKRGFGTRCKSYYWGCHVCEGWRAIDVLDDLLTITDEPVKHKVNN